MKYKIITLFFILYSLFFIQLYGQTYERTRFESRSFKVYEKTSVEIKNKYGNIHLFNWEKDSVRIEIKLEVKASKESKVDKIFDYIEFDFSSSKFYIIAQTSFRQQGGFWSELSDLANTLFSGNNKAQIDYNIYMPNDIDIKLENKFGNIYCPNHLGKFDADLSNGDLRANRLTGETNLDLSFSNAGINYIENGQITGSYIDMDINSAKELDLDSKSSTYNIGEIGVMNLQSRRDKFFIDELASISGETSFSYLTVKRFSKSMRLNTDYGELKIKDVENEFNIVDINSKFSDITLELQDKLSCDIEVEYTESTTLEVPESLKEKKTSVIDEKEGISKMTAFIGNKNDTDARIKIKIKSGNIYLRQSLDIF